MPVSLPAILERLNINMDAWLEQSQHFALLNYIHASAGLMHPACQKYYQRFA